MSDEQRKLLPQEPDEVPAGRFLLVAGVALVIFAAAIVWAAWLAQRGQGGLRTSAPGQSALGGREIGMVDQLPYGGGSAQEERRQQRKTLSQWAWVDREHGVVRMPIEDAMRRVAAGERP